MCELRAKLKKKEKKIAKRDAGFFIGRGVKKLLEICKKKRLNWNMILENNKKFVKKKTKKNAYTTITMSSINGKWEPQTVSNFNQILIF